MKKSGWITTAIVFGSIGLLILIVSIIWIITDNNYFSLFSPIDSKIASELGEYLSGFVGVFWTAAAAILIYATFKSQQVQIDKQQFESSFFNLINIYHSLVNSTEGGVVDLLHGTAETYNGRRFFSAVLKQVIHARRTESFLKFICTNDKIPEIKEFLDSLEIKKKSTTIDPKPEWEIIDYSISFTFGDRSKEFIVAQYEYIYRNFQTQLGHYFRFLYNIFKFVIKERSKYGDTKRYIDLVQAQMSSDELGLLYYNALSKYGISISGIPRFFNWLNDYDFFENIDPNSLINRKHHIFYKTIFKFLTPEEKLEKKQCSSEHDQYN